MRREVIAGITTFLTMSYTVVVNPSILSTPGTGIPFSGALTATVLVCFTMTRLMGRYAKLPFIGLQSSGFVADNPATLVGVGPLDHRAMLTLVGLLIGVWLSRNNNPLAYLASIVVVTTAAWVGGWVTPPANWFSAPDFSSVFFKLDIWGAVKLSRC